MNLFRIGNRPCTFLNLAPKFSGLYSTKAGRQSVSNVLTERKNSEVPSRRDASLINRPTVRTMKRLNHSRVDLQHWRPDGLTLAFECLPALPSSGDELGFIPGLFLRGRCVGEVVHRRRHANKTVVIFGRARGARLAFGEGHFDQA